MIPPIVRLYDSAERAGEAVERLKEAGVTDDLITLVPATRDRDEALQALLAAYYLKAHAEVFADRIADGRTFVGVRAMFGTGETVSRILDEYSPAEIPQEERSTDDPAPFSDSLGLPLLAKDPAPLSSLFFLPVLASPGPSLPTGLSGPGPSLPVSLGAQKPILTPSLGSQKPTTEAMGLPMIIRPR